MTDFQLGQRVIFTHPLKRVGTWDEEKRRAGKAWQPSRTESLAAHKEREGIIIGRRTLANGDTQWEEEGTLFIPTEHFQAYLIATTLHRKPSVVRMENVRPAPPVKWESAPDEVLFLNLKDAEQLASLAWVEGAAAGASVDMGYIPSDALTRQLPEHLADQFRALNPYTPREG